MKTDLAPPLARYRNEAVFRSAELLIASQSKKSTRNFPRWLVFTAGLLAGIGATIFVMRSRTGDTPTSLVSPAPGEFPAMAASVTQFLAGGILRGHLASEMAVPVSVEFTVRQVADGTGNRLTGVVRYLKRNDSIAEHRLEGVIEHRTLKLHETSRLWAVDASVVPIGRTFEVHLPVNPAQLKYRFGGTWSFGSQNGTISVVIANPW